MDRFLTVNVVAPWRRVVNGREAIRRIPILMYHAITDDPEPGVRGYYRLNTPPDLFRRHLEIIKDEGFTVIDLPTAVQYLSTEAQTPSSSSVNRPQSSVLRPPSSGDSALPTLQSAENLPLRNGERAGVRCPDHGSAIGPPSSVLRPPNQRFAVITFDDGFRDFATQAAPALAEYGFTATNFIITGSVTGRFKDRDCLSWSELRDLRQAGFTFGSHTVNHPKLWELAATELSRELVDSKAALEDKLGEQIDTFAHPYAFPRTQGDYVQRFTRAMKTAGYRCGVTTSLGCARPGADPLLLSRLPANGADDEKLFRAKLAGAYDWLAVPQAAFKRLKGNLRNPSQK